MDPHLLEIVTACPIDVVHDLPPQDKIREIKMSKAEEDLAQ